MIANMEEAVEGRHYRMYGCHSLVSPNHNTHRPLTARGLPLLASHTSLRRRLRGSLASVEAPFSCNTEL
jgi:hypothetical protein